MGDEIEGWELRKDDRSIDGGIDSSGRREKWGVKTLGLHDG